MAVRLANPMQKNAPGSRCTVAPRSVLTFVPRETRKDPPFRLRSGDLAIDIWDATRHSIRRATGPLVSGTTGAVSLTTVLFHRG